jgi:hypothetical protein
MFGAAVEDGREWAGAAQLPAVRLRWLLIDLASSIAHRRGVPTLAATQGADPSRAGRFPSTFPPPDAKPRGTERNGRGRRVTAGAVGGPFVLVTADRRGRIGMGRDPPGDRPSHCEIAGWRLPRFESWSCHHSADQRRHGHHPGPATQPAGPGFAPFSLLRTRCGRGGLRCVAGRAASRRPLWGGSAGGAAGPLAVARMCPSKVAGVGAVGGKDRLARDRWSVLALADGR